MLVESRLQPEGIESNRYRIFGERGRGVQFQGGGMKGVCFSYLLDSLAKKIFTRVRVGRYPSRHENY